MEGALLSGGRYNAAEEFGALYLSETPEGCAAEMARRPAAPQDYIVGSIRVTLGRICDLTDEGLLADLGLTSNQLKVNDWTDMQVLGKLVREAGFEAILVPSAAGDFNNLVIFMDRLSGKSEVALKDTRPLS
jgi:RES domain-containing protein